MARHATEKRFECKFCRHSFVLEHRYLEHKCQQMKRHEEAKTLIGQQAYEYYTLWLRNKQRMPPPMSTFLTSKYFRTFNNFAKFAKSVSLPMPKKFIWLMVKRDLPPSLWTSDEVYSQYIEFVDHKIPPLEQVKTSMETLLRITNKQDVDVSEAFNLIPGYDIIHMVRTRELSPWLLLFSSKFKRLFASALSPEQKIVLESLIRPAFWIEKFKEQPETVAKIKEYVNELGI